MLSKVVNIQIDEKKSHRVRRLLLSATLMSILLLAVCAGCLFEKSVGFNYYIPTGPGSPGLISYPFYSPFPAVWDPNCDKKKEGGEGSSESSGEEGGSKEGGSTEEGGSKEGGSSEEGGESKEGSSSAESEEGGGESKEGEGKSEESGSSEEGEKKEGSSEGSGEKKKEEKKKTKYVFPPSTFGFPPSQILYSPYSYVPYKASYVVQPPVASYPLKSSYRYVSVPSTAAFVNGYSAPIASRYVNSPITKIVYSPGLSYQQVPKTVVSPGARVFSAPGSWNSAYSYYKK